MSFNSSQQKQTPGKKYKFLLKKPKKLDFSKIFQQRERKNLVLQDIKNFKPKQYLTFPLWAYFREMTLEDFQITNGYYQSSTHTRSYQGTDTTRFHKIKAANSVVVFEPLNDDGMKYYGIKNKKDIYIQNWNGITEEGEGFNVGDKFGYNKGIKIQDNRFDY